jgi:hypothetical protein
MSHAKNGVKIGLYIGLLIISLCNVTWMQYMYTSSRGRVALVADESAAALACSVLSSFWCLVALAIHSPVLVGRAELIPSSVLFPMEIILNFILWVWIVVVTAKSTQDFYKGIDVCSNYLINCIPIFGWLMCVFIALLIFSLLLPTKADTVRTNGGAQNTPV